MHKSYKVRLYPNQTQKDLMDKTFGCCRFIYNAFLAERISVYDELKDDKDKLKSHKYKTESQYKEDFPWLKEVSSRALQQSTRDLNLAYQNFFRRVKQGKKPGFPKFKKKGKCKDSYREPQVGEKSIEVLTNAKKIKLMKLGKVKFRGLSKDFCGEIKSVTVTRTRSGKYIASILTEVLQQSKKARTSDNIIGIDLGLKEFVVCSNGEVISGIKTKMEILDKRIRQQQRHFSRKQKGSKRRENCRIKLNRLYEDRQNYLTHFQWHLANKLCSENQAISLENLNVAGMKKNRKLSRAIHNVNWVSFIEKLEQKAKEYETEIHRVNRFFPSSKLCSKCGMIKADLTLGDRVYSCGCGLEIDRDLNAAINLRNNYLVETSAESVDYRRGEIVRPKVLIYQDFGGFCEASIDFKERELFYEI